MRLTQFCHVVQQEEFRAKQGGKRGRHFHHSNERRLDGATNDISKDDRRGERPSRRILEQWWNDQYAFVMEQSRLAPFTDKHKIIVPRMPSLPELFAHESCKAVIICTFLHRLCAPPVWKKTPLLLRCKTLITMIGDFRKKSDKCRPAMNYSCTSLKQHPW